MRIPIQILKIAVSGYNRPNRYISRAIMQISSWRRMPMRNQRYMGVDFGEKRIGLAMADDELRMAVPHRVYEMGDDYQEDLEYLAVYIKSEADAIIIGLPLNKQGLEGEMCVKVREFARELQFLTDLPVHFQDERFSTRANEGLLQGMRTEDRKKLIDALAAAGILQTWLDRTRSRGEFGISQIKPIEPKNE
jgi:putative Holliday junction resolvase